MSPGETEDMFGITQKKIINLTFFVQILANDIHQCHGMFAAYKNAKSSKKSTFCNRFYVFVLR